MNRREFAGASLGAATAASLAASDEKIERARQAALAVMKPSKRDLEHGMALHADSIVFESYGFSPRGAPDGDALRAAIEAGASGLELQDMQEDMAMTRVATDPVERAEYLNAWKKSGVTCIFQNAGEESQDPMRLIKRLARFTYATDLLRDSVFRAVRPDDVAAAKRQNKHCLYFSGNGVPLAQQWVSVEEELRYVRIFFQLGIRMMHLTYNRRNMLGDGCAEPANAGLSDFGRAAVAEMNRVGVIVDVAHCGWRTSLEAARASKKPMVISHSGCAALNQHIRCKPDEVIRAVADTGGYIGICCIPPFLGRTRDINAMLDHIEYAVKRFGAEHVAIGTDVAYTPTTSAAQSQKIPRRARTRARFEYFWPDGALGGENPRQETLEWSNWPLFTVGMVQRGLKDDDIRRILGGNVLRVARMALAEAA